MNFPGMAFMYDLTKGLFSKFYSPYSPYSLYSLYRFYPLPGTCVLGFLLLCLLLQSPVPASAVSSPVSSDVAVSDVLVDSARVVRNGDLLSVSLDLDLSSLRLGSSRSAVLVPVLSGDGHRLELPAVGIYGRTRWYQDIRSGRLPLSGAGELSLGYSSRPGRLPYLRHVAYEPWMDGARLEVLRRDYGCCGTLLSQSVLSLPQPPAGSSAPPSAYVPSFRYLRPQVEPAKVRDISATAYVTYPTDGTEILPDYLDNRSELSKITSLIDSLRLDPDITLTSLSIKGFASPEGDYSRNERLARLRTDALKSYVSRLYSFGEGFISSSYEAEDWAGVRSGVERSSLAHRSELLSIIDDPGLSPDARDWRMKLRYPGDYRVILETIYPSLRRCDYRVSYTVRNYESVESIREVMSVSPQKLSLSEMLLLAGSLEPGSEEYAEVFETAVRLYPSDPVANLNAANVALSRRDLRRAERYLSKSGDSGEALYARGLLLEMQGDRPGALSLLGRASSMGIPEASSALSHLENSPDVCPAW